MLMRWFFFEGIMTHFLLAIINLVPIGNCYAFSQSNVVGRGFIFPGIEKCCLILLTVYLI